MIRGGTIKLRRIRGGVSIRATGDVAAGLAARMGDIARDALVSRRLRVRFADMGQGPMEWQVEADGRVASCGADQADVWVGARLHHVPVPGEVVVFSFPGRSERMISVQPVVAVELLP